MRCCPFRVPPEGLLRGQCLRRQPDRKPVGLRFPGGWCWTNIESARPRLAPQRVPFGGSSIMPLRSVDSCSPLRASNRRVVRGSSREDGSPEPGWLRCCCLGRGGLLKTEVNRKPPNCTVDLSLASSRENIGGGSVPSANGSFRSHLHRDMRAKPRAHTVDRWEAIDLRPAGTGIQGSAPL